MWQDFYTIEEIWMATLWSQNMCMAVFQKHADKGRMKKLLCKLYIFWNVCVFSSVLLYNISRLPVDTAALWQELRCLKYVKLLQCDSTSEKETNTELQNRDYRPLWSSKFVDNVRARGHPYHLHSINSSIFKAVFINRCIFSFVWLCEISWTIYYYRKYVFKCILSNNWLAYFVSVMNAHILFFTFKSTIAYAL